MPLPSNLLHRPRREAVRLLTLEQLSIARGTALRLDDLDDAEALHAFRVAIRRLRSLTKAWRRELKGLMDRQDRQALREIQVATGGGRDAEVTLIWLAEQRPELSARQRHGADWLEERLRARHHQAMSNAREKLKAAFAVEAERLNAELQDASHDKARKKRFGKAIARSTKHHLRDLRELLADVESAEDEQGLHQARIATKRLRYLVEPVRPHAPTARDLVEACKEFQDLLGDINDAHVQEAELASCIEEIEGSDEAQLLLPGLQELSRRQGTRLEALGAALVSDWLDNDLERFVEATRALIEELS